MRVEVFASLVAGTCAQLGTAQLAPMNMLSGKGFPYGQISRNIMPGFPSKEMDAESCRSACLDDLQCIAWETCAPVGDGCDGCYLIHKRAPREFSDRPGWHAEIIESRAGNLTLEEFVFTFKKCYDFVFEANGGVNEGEFGDQEALVQYHKCLDLLRKDKDNQNKTIAIHGQHYPTTIITHARDPPVLVPKDVVEDFSKQMHFDVTSGSPDSGPGPVVAELFANIETEAMRMLDEEGGAFAPHAYVVPAYDTNIGHMVKEMGSMNVMQSYHMQTMIREGDVIIDVGANLGSYTIPLAEKVGVSGGVFAFEPFRRMTQLLNANVALNGLSNVWVVPCALSDQSWVSLQAKQPQFNFFSSPGGVRAHSAQTEGMQEHEQVQLYDWDTMDEEITHMRLDDVLFADGVNQRRWPGIPPVTDVRLIKIDVEGMEMEVLKGAVTVLTQFRPIIWSENTKHWESDKTDNTFPDFMRELGYICQYAELAPNDFICFSHPSLGGHQFHSQEYFEQLQANGEL